MMKYASKQQSQNIERVVNLWDNTMLNTTVSSNLLLSRIDELKTIKEADSSSEEDINVKPFIKWAGGKGQLIEHIQKVCEIDFKGNFVKYAEPFVGGGAVLFYMLSKYKFQSVYISDINTKLINTYKTVRDNVDFLIEILEKIQKEYSLASDEKRNLYYYEKRDEFNNLNNIIGKEKKNIQEAALFIFLNKTCFNGLYRVNKKGFFNVPIGSYKNPLICDAKNLKNVSKVLRNVEITNSDYRESESFIDSNTFVYFDPPYRPLNKTSNFTAYTENSFGDEEQIELSKYIERIHQKGGKIMLSNSDPKNSDKEDNFFDDLYSSYKIRRITATRMINCNSKSRGEINELLITNF